MNASMIFRLVILAVVATFGIKVFALTSIANDSSHERKPGISDIRL